LEGRRLLFSLIGVAVLVVAMAVMQNPAEAKTNGKKKPVPAANLKSWTYGSGESANPYLVWTPKSYYRKKKAPLLLMVHGCQTTAAEQMHANLYNRLAGKFGFVVAYPDVDAIDRAMPGPLRNCWRFYRTNNWSRGSGEPAAIAGITRQIMKRRRIDRQRVYLIGMSAGGFMASAMAATYPDLYTAIGVNAGGAYQDGSCFFSDSGKLASDLAPLAREEMGSRARIVPRLVMGGDADEAIPPSCADKTLEQALRTNNLVLGASQESPISLNPTATREVAAKTAGGYSSTVSNYKDPNGCLVGQRWLIHGMNHFWPGGTKNPVYKNFTDPKGPSGAEISWRFFRRFTKKSTAMPCATR
jgi:poly(hydroxyalkanoate) depolymerase family esterase